MRCYQQKHIQNYWQTNKPSEITPDLIFITVPATQIHYGDVIMAAIASQITSLIIVYSTVYSYADQRKHQSSTSLAFVWGIHRGPGNSPHKWPVMQKMFPFDDVIMIGFKYSYTGWSFRMNVYLIPFLKQLMLNRLFHTWRVKHNYIHGYPGHFY